LSSRNAANCITHQEICDTASRLRLPYVETSALTQQGVKDCFETAVQQWLMWYFFMLQSSSKTMCHFFLEMYFAPFPSVHQQLLICVGRTKVFKNMCD